MLAVLAGRHGDAVVYTASPFAPLLLRGRDVQSTEGSTGEGGAEVNIPQRFGGVTRHACG